MKIFFIAISGGAIGWHFQVRQVVDDYPQIGNFVCEAHDRIDQGRVRIRRVQFQIRFGEDLEIRNERWFREPLSEISVPEIAVTDAAEQRILVEAFKLAGKFRLARFEISDCAHDNRIFGSEVEHPLVVFEPGARFNFDGAHDAERLSDSSVAGR